MQTSSLRFLSILFSVTALSTNAIASEWCPKHDGAFPAAVVDVGEYKSYYFAPDIYNEDGETAVVYLTKNNQLINVTSAKGYSDWFASTVYNGPANGFSSDSVTLDFESAWLIDENGQRQKFSDGEVRAPGYKKHELSCSDEK